MNCEISTHLSPYLKDNRKTLTFRDGAIHWVDTLKFSPLLDLRSTSSIFPWITLKNLVAFAYKRAPGPADLLCMWTLALICIHQSELCSWPLASLGTTSSGVGHSDYWAGTVTVTLSWPFPPASSPLVISRDGLFPISKFQLCVQVFPYPSLASQLPVPSPWVSPEFTLPLQFWQTSTNLIQCLQNQVLQLTKEKSRVHSYDPKFCGPQGILSSSDYLQ